MTEVAKALTIAGSDPIGGAGIQADLKTFQELKVYGMSVVTAVTSQNTLGVKGFVDIPLELIESQIDAVFEDVRPNAMKTGMLSNIPIIELVAKKVKEYKIENFIMDPVMVAKSGDMLIDESAKAGLIKELVPLANILTPNLSEAEALVGRKINTIDEMKEVAKELVHHYGAKVVVIKKGLFNSQAIDVYYDGISLEELTSPHFETKNVHGSGCTYSAAITAYLAQGKSPKEAVYLAKASISRAISETINIGRGNGPTNHWAL